MEPPNHLDPHTLRRSLRHTLSPEPLQICAPSESSEPLSLPSPPSHLTRSTRSSGSTLSVDSPLTINGSRSTPVNAKPLRRCPAKSKSKSKPLLLPSSVLRRSPRNITSTLIATTSTTRKRKLESQSTPVNPKPLRSSPRISASKPEPETKPLQICRSSKSISLLLPSSVLRRSPRDIGSASPVKSPVDSALTTPNPASRRGLRLEPIDSSACSEKSATKEDPGKSEVKIEEEEKILRRSPRAIAAVSLVDEYKCDEMKPTALGIPKKKEYKYDKNRKKKNNDNAPLPKGESDSAMKTKSENCYFVGESVPEEEAHQRWQWRYLLQNRRNKNGSLTVNANEDEPILQVKCHYTQAHINGCIFDLGDCALIRGEGRQKHIGKILEFCQTVEGDDYFRVQWFYKPEDTVMKDEATFHDKKRVFYSTIMNDNLLDCIVSKLNVVHVPPQTNMKSNSLLPFDFYYDMEYCLEYSTFRNLPRDYCLKSYELPSLSSPESVLSLASTPVLEDISICEPCNARLTLLDLYAGCGAMSTGLCIGARLAGIDLVTKWAVDYDSVACESLKLNHPETEVKNAEAEDFLELLKHWEKLCKKYVFGDEEMLVPSPRDATDGTEISDASCDDDTDSDELEVESLVDICYGDAGESGKQLQFKVRWKGYGPSDDTWEPAEGLSNCQELIKEFVRKGFNNKMLPLPGDVDVICGGPPCQGISGYNRFRRTDDPLTDERNRQLVIFMDIVEYLKPKFVLMENVTDILRFDKGSLGRYALSRLVHMSYQARIGIMAAGCYGLPQFRLRVFFWGALPSEELPQFPLPTHDVVVRYWPPPEFERNVVAYDEGCQPPELEDAVFLRDAISDLPTVANDESLDQLPYSGPPETEFQKYIRSTKYGSLLHTQEDILYDHRPHQLFEDDYLRVCQIPHRKGANFRDLPGVVVGDDNVVRRDPSMKPVFLPSGMPLVPAYALTFEQGKSKRPFARIWWDETMATVVTSPNCHSQAILHPEQDRVLTVRECARLQGFPDSYRFCGTVKRRYRQIGNAVAIPVAKALGYALGMASQKLIDKEPLTTLPPKFAYL